MIVVPVVVGETSVRRAPHCTASPHLQSWSMMRYWGVTKRPPWQRKYIARINRSVQQFGR